MNPAESWALLAALFLAVYRLLRALAPTTVDRASAGVVARNDNARSDLHPCRGSGPASTSP